MRSKVVEAMLPYFTEMFGNAGSRNHQFGWQAEDGIEIAREHAAKLIGAQAKEVIFTSGSTESNNLAIKGAAEIYARAAAGQTGRGHIITAAHEHKAVLDPIRRLMREGFDATFIQPPADGVITAEMVKAALRPDTILVSIMWANNELGTINEVPQIGRLCHEKEVIFHTDATQWVGKMPTNVEADQIDLLSWSGHKMYGPKELAGFMFVDESRAFVWKHCRMAADRNAECVQERRMSAESLDSARLVNCASTKWNLKESDSWRCEIVWRQN